MPQDRSSEADAPKLLSDRQQIARKEAENTLRQFDHAISELDDWLKNPNYRLRPSTILTLNRYALDGISAYAGVFRPAGVTIKGSRHEPIPATEVPREIEELCDYVHDRWDDKSAVHLAAYAMWRLNWIHPFVDGNGRTARIVSYLVLCAKFGARIPGRKTIPEQVSANKSPYYKALEAADIHYKVGKKINVSQMETLLDGLLAGQLVSIHEDATGNNQEEGDSEKIDDKSPHSASSRAVGSRHSGVMGWIEAHPVIAGGIFLLLATILGALIS